MLPAIASVPLTITYLGDERFGLWMTIASFSGLLTFADLGLGTGILNTVARANALDDKVVIRRCVCTATYMLVGVATLILLALAGTWPFISWSEMLNAKTALAVAESAPAFAIFVILFAANLPLGVIQRVQMGFQEAFATNMWQSLGSILALVGVLSFSHFQLGLPWLILSLCGGPVLAAALNTVIEFAVRRPWLLPRLNGADLNTARTLLKTGTVFVGIQALDAVALLSDNFLIAHTLSPAAVTVYAVPFRLFSLTSSVPMFVLLPFWAAYGEALARGDHKWIASALRRTTWVGLLLAALVPLVLLVSGQGIITRWTRGQVQVPYTLLAAMAFSSFLVSATQAQGIFLLASHKFRFLLGTRGALAITAIGLKLYLLTSMGLIGAPCGLILAYVLCVTVPIISYLPKVLREIRQNSACHGAGLQHARDLVSLAE